MATETRYSDLKESGAVQTSPPTRSGRPAEREISLLDLLIVLVERKRIILLVTAVCALLALVVSLLLPKWYTAMVILLPPQQSSSLGSALTSQLGNLGSVAALAGGSLGIKNPNDMYVAMLRSQTVEDGMVRRFGLQREYHKRLVSEARKAFENHAAVDGAGKDGLIHISVEDPQPGSGCGAGEWICG